MRLIRTQFWLLGLLALGSCDPGILTQVIIEYRGDDATIARASLVRIRLVREGLAPIAEERTLTVPDPEAMFPLTVPLEPHGGDSSRRFQVEAELEDEDGEIFLRTRTIGGFEQGKRLVVVVRMDASCSGIVGCQREETCVEGSCQAACVVPVVSEGRRATPNLSCARYRKRIRVVSSEPDNEVAGMPFAIRLIDSDLAREARMDGGDIAFVDTNGAALPHELIDYDSDTGALIAWVRAPVIRPDVDTEFFMYFGGVSVPAEPGAVWSDFAIVWHLDEESGVAIDQSPLNNASDGDTVSRGVPGVIHRARDMPTVDEGGPQQQEYVVSRGRTTLRGLELSSEDSFSVSVWAKVQSDGGDQRLVFAGGNGSVAGFMLRQNDARIVDSEMNSVRVGPVAVREDEWQLRTLVVDRSVRRATLYLNGEPQGQAVDITGLGSPTPTEAGFFVGGAGGCCFAVGVIDEVWLERSAWSRSRVRATYLNQVSPEDSFVLGELERIR